ncbi:crinkler (CRN) family protein, putative [Phytophthora infestans T30-4]|uniref:Crinkler (CRN) family protein, putative n=1 Tax=Phytophthora infestans (strain T30-4) TaxID=403677 RepID=D0MT11_PHYIT|nr:crinkler (CRN) family protein, putative [Phytophthora infestans T30-4]EEY57595.1 crinkler (CRN) family protein, putative [Phytophthora infestans T30-4]|eukprot:XP_002908781.1 crinkler (CRN) family protein, putative [Phytophthora infestans T30-4]
MEEASLFCAIIGVERVFLVDILQSKTVGHLKIAIKKQKTGVLGDVDADRLQLFLAWNNSKWLTTDSFDVEQLRQGRTTEIVDALTQKKKELIESAVLDKVLGDKGPLTPDQFHVLVTIAPLTKLKRQREEDYEDLNTKRLNFREPTLTELLENCNVTGSLPPTGDFLKMFEWSNHDCGKVKDIKAIGDIVGFTGRRFYVRKEILCVLENFKDFLQDKLATSAKVNLDNSEQKQFIFTGSPGTGKSTILALICFYLGIVKKLPVVWYRCIDGGGVKPVTTLLYEGKYYRWIEELGGNGKMYEYFCKPGLGINKDSCWFCLDGLNQDEIKRRGYQNYFTLLATSAQFNPNGEGGNSQVTCLLPYWKQADLEFVAGALGIKDESDVAKKYFVSGGSIRDFLLPVRQAEIGLARALSRLTSESANVLLGVDGCTSDKQIDRIRIMGVLDVADVSQYTLSTSWRPCVSSIMALNHLSGMVQPGFFEKLAVVAKSLDDPRLQGVALEQFFHALVRRQDFVQISYMKYDNVHRTSKVDYQGIMKQEMGTMSFGRSIDLLDSNKPLYVKREGKTMDDYESVMKRWAANPCEMDYWVPASSMCETIDAVAKWELVNGQESVEHFCLVQLTKAIRHVCKEDVLWKLAQPFLDAKKKVCYVALLFDDDGVGERAMEKIWKFRLDPVMINTVDGQNHIPLYVATYQRHDVQAA